MFREEFKKKEKAKLDAIRRMSLIAVILYCNTWRSQRNAIYLAKINRRLEKQYQVVQELQTEEKERGRKEKKVI